MQPSPAHSPAHSPAANDNTPRPASFDAAVLQWMPFLHKMASKLEASAQDREDLVNETVEAALRRWANYREGESLPGWLVFQMRERIRSLRRRWRVEAYSYDSRNRDVDEESDDDYGVDFQDPLAEPARQDNIVELSQVVSALRPGRNGEVLYRVAQGDNGEDIAADYGITREYVRQIAQTERERLRKSLNAVRRVA